MEFLRKQTTLITDPDFESSIANVSALLKDKYLDNSNNDHSITLQRNQILDALRAEKAVDLKENKTP